MHSKSGITSFVLSLVALVCGVITIVLDGIMYSAIAQANGGYVPNTNPLMMVFGVLIIIVLLMAIVGLIFGIVGCIVRDRRKGLAVAGLVINAVLIVLISLILAIGMTA